MFVARLATLCLLLYITLGQRWTMRAPTGGRGTVSPLEVAFVTLGAALALHLAARRWSGGREPRRRVLEAFRRWWLPTVGPLLLLLVLLPIAGVVFRGYQLRTLYGVVNAVAPIGMVALVAASGISRRHIRWVAFAAIVMHGAYGLGQMLFRIGLMPPVIWNWAFHWDVQSQSAYSAKYLIYGRSTGLFINANEFGMWSLLAIAFAVAYMERRMRAVGVALGIAGVVGSQSRTAWVGLALLAVGFFVVTVFGPGRTRRRTALALVAFPALAIAGALIEPDSVSRLSSGVKVLTQGSGADPNLALRYQEWARALRFSAQYPLGTWGPPQVRFGSFIDSQFVSYYLQGGILLIVAYGLALFAPILLWRRGFPNAPNFVVMGAAIAVFSYTALPLDNPMVSALVWIAVGLSAAAKTNHGGPVMMASPTRIVTQGLASSEGADGDSREFEGEVPGVVEEPLPPVVADAARRQIVLLWLERATDGTAAGAHLRGTRARVEAIPNASIVAVISDVTSPDGRENYVKKAIRLAALVIAGCASARRGRTLIARHHPFVLPVVLVWKLIGAKVVLSIQGSLDDIGENEYRWLRRVRVVGAMSVTAAKKADGLIVGAPVLLEHVQETMWRRGTPLVAIPNGVFIEQFMQARDALPPRDGDYVVFVGNLAAWQGVETMVLATEDPAWPETLPLVVVGDGTERHRLVGRRQVIWLGRRPAAEAAVWLAHAYCALALKRSETAVGAHGYWPFKIIEGAAAGVPMICSNAKGMSLAAGELGHALLVPADDPAATARAVGGLYRNRELRAELAKAGLANAGRFSWEAGAQALASLLDSVASVHGEAARGVGVAKP